MTRGANTGSNGPGKPRTTITGVSPIANHWAKLA